MGARIATAARGPRHGLGPARTGGHPHLLRSDATLPGSRALGESESTVRGNPRGRDGSSVEVGGQRAERGAGNPTTRQYIPSRGPAPGKKGGVSWFFWGGVRACLSRKHQPLETGRIIARHTSSI